ncbi:hypothetical protein FQN60_017667, partial [Etheostoma spectabile]
ISGTGAWWRRRRTNHGADVIPKLLTDGTCRSSCRVKQGWSESCSRRSVFSSGSVSADTLCRQNTQSALLSSMGVKLKHISARVVMVIYVNC